MYTRLYRYITILASVGLLLAVYLLWQQIARPAFQPCNVNSFINCEAVISGEVAKTFGVPTPLFGLVGYAIILIAALVQKKSIILGAASFGLAFCLWIAYKELFLLRVICPICITCQIIMITIFSMSIALHKQKN
jgi:uncharacterized membrane protein